MAEDVFETDTSFAQQSMWLLHQIDPGKPTYNVISATRVRGRLMAGALQSALNSVVDRHESLRTVFRLDGDAPVQVILPSMAVPLPVVDVHPSEVDSAVQREVETPLDLERGPLLRMRLLRVAPDDHVLVLVMHHIVTDGWSSAIVFRELSHYYQGQISGQHVELPELPIQYADYAEWQRETLSGPRLQRLLDYWTKQLDRADPLRLPTDRPRPAVRSNRGETLRFEMPGDLMTGLEAFARQRRATPFMVMLAALQALFARESGQHDITVSTAVANRDRPEIAGLIGYFVNTLALRTDLSGNPTVAELVDRARETCRQAYGHQELPFDKVVETVRPHRDGGIGNALVRAMLVVQNMPSEPWQSGDLVFEPLRLDNRTTLLDMSVVVEPAPAGGHQCMIEYSADLFEHATIARFGKAYLAMLAAFVADPAARLDGIELPGEAEWAGLLGRWNATARAMPAEPVHHLIASQAARTPDAVAVAHGDTKLTYAELDRRADRLARVIRAVPIEDECVVAIAMAPDDEFVVALLAVMKSGGAFLPLDPHLPPARLAEMARDSGARVVLTRRSLEPVLAEVLNGRKTIFLDHEHAAADGAALGRPQPAGLAGVFYTSGSTNVPKGVMFTHDALVNFTVGIAERFALTADDRYAQLSSIGFDVMLEELLPALVVGATVVLPTERILATGGDLTGFVRQHRITVVDLTPAYWHEWVSQLNERGEVPVSLRLAVVGGDRVLAECVATWRRFDADLIEVYGLTEATVTSTTCSIRAAEAGPAAVVGTPVANTTVHVLDHRLRPVPAGVVGDVYIGGAGLARGYLGIPGETAARFVPDPAGPPGARMCRTGDLARRRPDGEIEFVGRADNQVKIRGHRVDPGEVEAALASHPTVGRTAVLAQDAPGGKRLVAFVEPMSGAEPAPDALREFLAGLLPAALVPATVLVVSSMPLTPNGKVDRNALAATEHVLAPDAAKPDATGQPVSRDAASPREKVLCGLVADLLGLGRVGAEDDFFAIGGDSIRAIQLASRARAAGVFVTPRDVFIRRSAARMALAADDPGVVVTEDPAAGIGPVGPTPAVCRLAGSGGRTGGFSQFVLVRVPAGLSLPSLVEATQAVLDRHDALRLTGSVVAPRGEVRAENWVSRVDVDGTTESQLRNVIAERAVMARGELDPGAGENGRVLWFDAGAGEGRILVVLHHFVVDAVSWRILLPDLAFAYQQIADGTPAELVAAGTSFRQWTHGLAAAAKDPARTGELRFWREMTRTPDPLLGSRPLRPDQDLAATARTATSVLPPDVAGPLLSDLPAVFHAGADDVLLTGLSLAVAQWRKRRGHAGRGVLVDLEGHGREEQVVPGADLTRTVGWFTSQFPVALDPGELPWDNVRAGKSDLGTALKRVKEQLRAVPGNGIGYGLLRYLNPATAAVLASVPTPQIGFNYLGRFGAGAADHGFGWSLDRDVELPGSGLDPAMPLEHVLEVNAVAEELADGLTLTVNWLWAGDILSEQDIRDLEADWFLALGALAGQAGEPGAGGLTPSDLPLMSLTQAEIEELEAELGNERGVAR